MPLKFTEVSIPEVVCYISHLPSEVDPAGGGRMDCPSCLLNVTVLAEERASCHHHFLHQGDFLSQGLSDLLVATFL